MLYKKNSEEKLSKELFKNPTCEFRGTPFWAWNSWLEKDELERQIGIFKEMGFGGFHMHSRSGMSMEYLGEGFMNCVKYCVGKAKETALKRLRMKKCLPGFTMRTDGRRERQADM